MARFGARILAVLFLAAAAGACRPAPDGTGGFGRTAEAAGPADAARRAAPAAAAERPGPGGGPGETREGSAGGGAEPVRRPPPGYAWVIFGADTVLAEVAATPEEREQGLMYRDEVPDGRGMLFVFDDLRTRSFWMQNTYVALDIAYMDASYVVVDIQQMEPLTTDPHDSAAPAMFALEVRKGWFAEHGIGVGARARVEFGVPGRR